jgi:FkbM family methyltransferase
MPKSELIKKLDALERVATASRLHRLLTRPFRYVHAILFRELVYAKTKQGKEVVCRTFFGQDMHVLLPSSTDIYLTGGKTHESEIRLARFLIHCLKKGDILVDAGAHYGYFTLLAAQLVGQSGKVVAFEGSATTFKVLQKNTASFKSITAHHLALSDTDGELVFYEFPNQYAEYNALDIQQFRQDAWIGENPPREYRVQAVSLDGYLEKANLSPTVIKIDVEGAEYQVIQGMGHFLEKASPVVIMEYLSGKRSGDTYLRAEQLLTSLGYTPFAIDRSGALQPMGSAAEYMSRKGLESDNIVFCKHVVILRGNEV